LDVEVNAYLVQPASQSTPIPKEITTILFGRFVTISTAKSFVLGGLRVGWSHDCEQAGHENGNNFQHKGS
jgi:hypothetical protein